ncbi:TlpA disulfide reductase family protein [Legionella fairfieldensis]|uniref:TlpA disulfide reductase family protein n=1 Tax=Legionella fairfieldensis TaxID=45064 RepID=UPI001F5FB322|nr:TlpA disulfide reductase family protein [Legionella fairfieldensis]
MNYCHSSTTHVVLKNITGQTIPFSSLKGKWVLINYWASWCQPCLDEIGELNQFNKKKKDNVILFAVNYDRLPLSRQLALIKKYNINYPSLENPGSQLQLGDIRGVPVTFIFNPEGKLTNTLYGGQTAVSLNQILFSK